MSRLGKFPVVLPEGVTAILKKSKLTVKGPKGELEQVIHGLVDVQVGDKDIKVDIKNKDNKKEKAFWGLFRSLINNMVIGVTDGFEKKLEVNGVGYRIALQGKKLVLNLGFSHPVEKDIPEGLEVQVETNIITITGISKQAVGEFAAQIRKLRKPEPYKGKGIKYVDEVIRRKEGKTAAKSE